MTPGSAFAKALGCTCPEVENNYGNSIGFSTCGEGARYLVAMTCTLHGAARWGVPQTVAPDKIDRDGSQFGQQVSIRLLAGDVETPAPLSTAPTSKSAIPD